VLGSLSFLYLVGHTVGKEEKIWLIYAFQIYARYPQIPEIFTVTIQNIILVSCYSIFEKETSGLSTR
jgi:hypothetical protein